MRSVIHVAGEHSDYAHTGGLGEVVAGLSRAQAAAGAQVSVVLPGYARALGRLDGTHEGHVEVELPWGRLRFDVYGRVRHGVHVRMLHEPSLFDRPELYGPPGGAYADNGVRFSAFCRAAVELVAREGLPDVLHLHDWHAGLVAPLLAGWLPRPRLVMTVHNLAFQGLMPVSALPVTGLEPSALGIDGVLHRGQISLLKAGLQFADLLTTVSPTYARELQQEEGGWDLAGLFRWRRERLVGLVNGVEVDAVATPAATHAESRRALCAEAGLSEPRGPLFSMITRLTGQKGVDLFVGAIPEVLGRGAAAVVLGTGEAWLSEALRGLERDHPGRVAFLERFDPQLAERVYAGSDVVCVPSRFEPCGMVQLHAMRHGALPLVRHTGGLADTVKDVAEGGWGFVFEPATVAGCAQAMQRACTLYAQPEAWQAARRRALAQRVDWGPPAERYLALYARPLDALHEATSAGP